MASFTGTNGNDNGTDAPPIVGGVENDVLQGLDGDDILNGNAGDDSLEGGRGDDSLLGGAGDDTLYGGPGVDTLLGNDGDDTLMWSEPDREEGLWDGGNGTDTALMQRWQPAGLESIQNIVFRNMEIFDAWNLEMIISPGQLDDFDRMISSNEAPSTSNFQGFFRHSEGGSSDLSGVDLSGFKGRFTGSNLGDDVFRITGGDTGWEMFDSGGNDLLEGGEGGDTMNAGAGNDTLIGNGGDDQLDSTSGDELIQGGSGNDTIRVVGGNQSADTIEGGDGTDTLVNRTFTALQMQNFTITGVEVLIGGGVLANAGQLDGFDDIQQLSGLTHNTPGTTDLTGSLTSGGQTGVMAFNGSQGDDNLIAPDTTVDIRVNAGRGNDSATSGAGDDVLQGGGGDNVLRANGGNDSLEGREGDDVLDGGAGDDTIHGGTGVDTIIAGDGDDLIFGRGANSPGVDLRDVVYGGNGNDSIDGDRGNDELRGDAGNDTIIGGFGVDTIVGGTGDDVLTGQAWSDLIFGGAGNDFVNGGFGYDRVNGGDDADRFYHLGVADHGSDWIQDYNAAEGDVLEYGGGEGEATADDFLVQVAETANAGVAGVQEAFITHIPSGNLLWALVDGDGQDAINLQIGGDVFDLLA
ncbi:calcium-binding protein [Lutimaribacter marinistellae]|uniref:Calcium-binding protein n=1 Tax=Lutimaribacter marinistellae TaxID=1820329 RepID=A0ABV7TJD0_9RHOB